MNPSAFSAPFSLEGPRAFVASYEAAVRPLRQEHGEVYWNFALGGNDQLQSRLADLEQRLSDLHADATACDRLDEWLRAGTDDALLQRQLELLLPEFRRSQVDEGLRRRIIELGLRAEEAFTTFRPVVDGRTMTSNQLDRELLLSTDDGRRRVVWEATRDIGR